MQITQGSTTREKLLTDCLIRLDESLAIRHPSMQRDANPVALKLLSKRVLPDQLAPIILQYSLLPHRIISILAHGKQNLANWPIIQDELERNIAEEKGSRTHGVSHYEILKTCLLSEAQLDISPAKENGATKKCLDNLERLASNFRPSLALGSLYGLESAALPELLIVADLINQYWAALGHGCILVDTLFAEHTKPTGINFSLTSFFQMHLFDFEVGHKHGLATSIRRQERIDASIDLAEFELGFECVLHQMDQWWDQLAALC